MEESQNVIDWSYRPSGYFWAKDRRIFLASDIKGGQRRKFYERLLQSGDQEAIDEFVLKSSSCIHGRGVPARLRAHGS
jgi:hypothetical protein